MFQVLSALKHTQTIPGPASCDLSPEDAEFKEEDDCLLDLALAYFDELAKYDSQPRHNKEAR